MKNRLVKIFFLVFFIGLFVYYYVSNPDVFQSIKLYDYRYILLGSAYTLVTITANGLLMKLILDSRAKTMSFLDGFYTSFMSTLVNNFLPLRGGSLVRAGYLKKKYSFQYRDFIAMLYGNYVLIFAVSSFIGIVSVILLSLGGQNISTTLILVFVLIFSASAILLSANDRLEKLIFKLLNLIKFKPLKYISRKGERIIDGWKIIAKNKKLLRSVTILIVINTTAQAIFYYAALNVLGAQVSIVQVLLFTSVTILSIFFSVTPGSIGVRETLLIIFAGSLSLTNEQILSATLLDRATTLIVLAILFIVFQFFTKTRRPSNIWHDTFGKTE